MDLEQFIISDDAILVTHLRDCADKILTAGNEHDKWTWVLLRTAADRLKELTCPGFVASGAHELRIVALRPVGDDSEKQALLALCYLEIRPARFDPSDFYPFPRPAKLFAAAAWIFRLAMKTSWGRSKALHLPQSQAN
jgi:hypothetical protein